LLFLAKIRPIILIYFCIGINIIFYFVVIFFEHAVERQGPELYTFTTTMALVRVRIGQKKGKLVMKEKTGWQGIYLFIT